MVVQRPGRATGCWLSMSRMKAMTGPFIPGKARSVKEDRPCRRMLGRKLACVTLIAVTDQEFEQAVSDHYTHVFHFALSLTKDQAEACDLTQETYRRLASKGRHVQEASRLKSWLMTTCYREFLRHHRRRLRFPHVEISLVEHALPVVTPDQVNHMDAATLMKALREIDELYRVPVMLFYLQG